MMINQILWEMFAFQALLLGNVFGVMLLFGVVMGIIEGIKRVSNK